MAEALGLGRPTSCRRLAGGLGNRPLLVGLASGEQVVVKTYGDRVDAALGEMRNLERAGDASVTTPEPIALDLAGDWLGEISLAMTFIDGKPGFCEDDQWIRQLAVSLVSIHEVTAEAVVPIFPEALSDHVTAMAQFDERMQRVAAPCACLVSGTDDAVFAHGDFHPGNVLFNGGVLAGVVDWCDAGVRERASDVSYCRGVLAVHPGGAAPDQFLAAYQAELGRHVSCAGWDALWAARGVRGATRKWPAAFAELEINLTSEQVQARSNAWLDAALARF